MFPWLLSAFIDAPQAGLGAVAVLVLFAVLLIVLIALSLGSGPVARRAERRLTLLSDLVHVLVSRGRCRCRRCGRSR